MVGLGEPNVEFESDKPDALSAVGCGVSDGGSMTVQCSKRLQICAAKPEQAGKVALRERMASKRPGGELIE